MREHETSAPSIPSEWGAAVAAKVARAIRDACGVEVDKHSFAADEIDDACEASVKAALQALAEAFVIPGDVLATPPTTMAEAVASARAEAIEEFGASTEDELDERIARQGARENMRLIDSISDLIGQPHDVELTKSDVANALASARAEGVKEGLERAAAACRKVRGGGYLATPSDCVRAVQNELDAIASWRPSPAPPTLIPGGSSDV